MNQQQTDIREQQRQSWNRFAPGWEKWDTLTMDFLSPLGTAIVESLQLTGSEHVLDIACGTGEPGLTIAGKLPQGHVTLTDLSEEMIGITRDHARHRGITNIKTLVCDVCELPFPDYHFDAISCRFGYMFFPDMNLAAQEMYRVLKPGGRMSTSVWDIPENNFWVTALMGTIQKNLDLPPNPSGAPGMFRCSKPGQMQYILEEAGFRGYEQKIMATHLPADTIDTYWNMMTEVGAPIVAALSQATEEQKASIKKQVFELVAGRYPDGKPALEGSAIFMTAVK